MKVLMVNGSAKAKGCTFTALQEVGKELEKNGIEYEIFQLGAEPQRDCTGCYACKKNGNKCVFKENRVDEFVEKAYEADAFIFGSPVYFAHPSGRILSFLDRAFVSSSSEAFKFKPAAAVVSARRGGTTATLDALNKLFAYASMPQIGSTYWNMVHGSKPEQVEQDLEGLQTMRNLGKNMAWILKCIEIGKQNNINKPELEKQFSTNFIR